MMELAHDRCIAAQPPHNIQIDGLDGVWFVGRDASIVQLMSQLSIEKENLLEHDGAAQQRESESQEAREGLQSDLALR